MNKKQLLEAVSMILDKLEKEEITEGKTFCHIRIYENKNKEIVSDTDVS